MASERTPLRAEDLIEHLDWMRRLSRALTGGDAAEADDLTSDAIEAALDQRPVVHGPVRPWLAGVLRNLARMRVRTGARRRRRDLASGVPDAAAPSPAELVERVEAQRLVASLVIKLAEPFRSTLLLRYYEGLSAADVGRRLGVPAGTVRWRIKHSLGELRAALDQAHGGNRQRWSALLLPLAAPPATPAPAPAPTRPRAPRAALPSVVKGAITVSAKAKILVAGLILVLLAAGTAGWRARQRRGDATAGAGAAAAASTTTRPAFGAVLRLARGRAWLAPVETLDPDGALRVEGQVIDEQENPIDGAVVAIDSNPPRTVMTRADGGFVLDKLMPRLYRLEAHAGERYAGPVETRVSRASEPVVLRARAGRLVNVQVRAAADDRPVAGATVSLRAALQWTDRTDAAGVAKLAGVGPGWASLRVEAAGFATANSVLTGNRGRQETVEVRLQRGQPVAGRVVTPLGAPIAGARVWAALTSEPFPAIDPRLDGVVADELGRWTMPALAAGTYRFEASHPDHAQGATGPTAIDGRAARAGIEIALEDGGAVSGQVRRADGTPVPAAQVRAAVKGGVAWRLMREAFTGADGSFRLRGLPRRALDILAMHAEGSSAITTLDLGASAAEARVTLTITCAGAIDGVVLDGVARPIAEAQVVAEPEGRADVATMREWDVRGTPSFISDAAGRFHFGGLPDRSYRIRAARPGAAPDAVWLHPGVVASAGDRNVRIAVPGNGAVSGTVVYVTGGVPARFSVQIGSVAGSFASASGAFTLEVPAGRHDLVISGPTFIAKRVEDADVQEDDGGGRGNDVGVIKVERGRSVSGVVVRADGTPVAGADVAAGELLTGDGRKLNIPEEGHGVQETRSDEDGRFVMTGFDETPLVLVAERAGAGRSKSMTLPRGPASVDVELVLEPTGGLAGTVSRAGKPLPGTVVIANPRGETRSNFLVISGPDGRFDFDVLAAGPYRVSAMIGEGGARPKDMHSNSGAVDDGGRGHADVDIEIPTGPITLSLDVRTDDGGVVPAATVVVLTGDARAPNLEALRDRARDAPDGPAAFYLRDWRAPAPGTTGALRIAGLNPGTYTVCAIAIPADPARPLEMERALARLALRPAVCKVSALSSSAELTVTVPAASLAAK